MKLLQIFNLRAKWGVSSQALGNIGNTHKKEESTQKAQNPEK